MKLITLIKKDLKLFVTDKKAMMLTYLLPVALISLFALAYGGIGGKKANPQKVLLCDQDSTKSSIHLAQTLDSLPEIRIENISTTEQGISAIKNGDALAFLMMGNGYQKQLLDGEKPDLTLYLDKSREIESGLLQHVIMGPIMEEIHTKGLKNRIVRGIKQRYPNIPQSSLKTIENDLASGAMGAKGTKEVLKITRISPKKGVNWGLIQAVAGTAVMMLLFSAAGMGSGLLSEKEKGTLARLLFSPVKAGHILTGHLIYSSMIAISQLLVMFLFAWLIFGLEIGNNWPALLLCIILTALTCSTFGTFLSSMCQTRKQLESLSTVFILIMSGIGGSMVPLFLLPEFMQKIALITVNYWALDAFYDILGRGLPIAQVLPNLLAMLLISTTFIGISALMFRRKLSQLVH